MRLRRASLGFLGLAFCTVICGGTACTSSGRSAKGEVTAPAGKDVAPNLPEAHDTPVSVMTADTFAAQRAAAKSMTTADFERNYALPYRDRLPYAPLGAKGLDAIEKEAPLAPDEKQRLARDGFVLLDHVEQPTFAIAYADAFRRHLPVYISADSILLAVHKSYASLLKSTEYAILVRDLTAVVGAMRDRLKAGLPGMGADVKRDVDEYLAVAASLLSGETKAPVATGRADAVKAIVDRATSANGMGSLVLFGNARDVDFSQFKPRAHYVGVPALEHYFRAMIWLARTDFRPIETKADGAQIFRRRQLEDSLALRELMSDDTRATWTRIDRTLAAFVGEPDEMNVRDLDTLVRELGVAKLADLGSKSDDAIVATFTRTGLGQQRIASQLMVHGLDAKGTLPLHVSFALINQRYTLDAHVLSNVSYDRVQSGAVKRMMPDPLDVAFAALGNDGAAELLRSELDHYGYAPDLQMMRLLASAHGEEYWQSSLYTTWSFALRALSPTVTSFKAPKDGGLPAVATTHAWNNRILNTQLASWSELRHDTVLYTKQSYSSMALCEFPDAYVEPYPEFFHRIALHARLGKQLVADSLSSDPSLATGSLRYFTRLDEIATNLEQMAAQERAGKPFTKEQMDFVNDMVNLRRVGCGGPSFTGWYGDLFIDRNELSEFAPTITDVHTQPTDETGAPVGRVLHVGTGFVNGLVVTVDSCKGPRAYAGYVSSYFEKTTSNFERMDDQQWETQVRSAPKPKRPAWMADLSSR